MQAHLELDIKHVKNAAITIIADSVYLVYQNAGPKCRVGTSKPKPGAPMPLLMLLVLELSIVPRCCATDHQRG